MIGFADVEREYNSQGGHDHCGDHEKACDRRGFDAVRACSLSWRCESELHDVLLLGSISWTCALFPFGAIHFATWHLKVDP
ncbi:hypothetical protein AS032_26845 [Rhodococcus qingshengii]|nr:hypothetical protein AOT96_31660 [Rhodococcus sp. 008]KSU70570.1 hypothetical protein AS032_26845 [Rhodococcus qingshengii]